MGTNPTIGTPTVAQRTFQQSASFKALAKRIASKLRCGLPGIITAFDPIKQYASVQLAITENLIKTTGGVEIKRIPIIDDVLVLFPGDANWCLTFPSIVGSECYVCFADMCVNAWATHGFGGALPKPIPRNQEVQRRHDLSDGFAILAPRSQPKVISGYSVDAVELRSMDGTTKLQVKPYNVNVSGNLNVGSGASGTFTDSTGVIITVINGIIIDIGAALMPSTQPTAVEEEL